MKNELLVTVLEPQQLNHLVTLRNSVLFNSKDRQTQRIIKGAGMGAYQELTGDGLREVAQDIIFQAREDRKTEASNI